MALGPSPSQVQDEIAIIDASAAAGAEYLVKQSTNGVDDTSIDNVIYQTHRAIEGHLAGAGLASTIIRCSTFIDAVLFISTNFVPQDAWGGNTGDSTCTFIDTRDVADVAVTLLRQGAGRRGGEKYTLTGPEALSMARAAELISAAVGHKVNYHRRTEAESKSFLSGLGLPELQVALLLALDQLTREGVMSAVGDDVPVILGKPARSAAAYVGEFAPQLPQLAAAGG